MIIPDVTFTYNVSKISNFQFEIAINATSQIESGTIATVTFSKAVTDKYNQGVANAEIDVSLN